MLPINSKQPVSVAFTEDMKGYFSPGASDPKMGHDQGEATGRDIMFHLTIKITDVDFFCVDPREQGRADGYIESSALGGRCTVENGAFRLFTQASDEPGHANVKNMHYQLAFVDADGNPRTLSGRKIVRDDGVRNIWPDTSTLYFTILEGHVDIDTEGEAIGAGILHILPEDFAKQMTTFKTTGPSVIARAVGKEKFFKVFAGSLWAVYGPNFRKSEPDISTERDIPMFTMEGVRDAEVTHHQFLTADKLSLRIIRMRRAPSKDVVILMHGHTTSTDMFVMPEHYNLVNYLHDNGYTDVFSFDWRGSMRYPYCASPNSYNMDDVALYDHPAALAEVRKLVGDDVRIHVICHCVGSVTFHMSLFSGLVNVDSVISNSVSLHQVVSRGARIKMAIGLPLMIYLMRYSHLNPRFATLPGPGFTQGKLLGKLAQLMHPECDVPACNMLSFMWGFGFPSIYRHENMLEVTHRRVGDLFGPTNFSWHTHIRKCVKAGYVLKYDPTDSRYDALPDKYLEHAAKVKTPILYISGKHNNVFTTSNKVTYDALCRLHPEAERYFEYRMFEDYGHQDTLMGRSAAEDVFPYFLEFLQRNSG